jgi:hypothetical protein
LERNLTQLINILHFSAPLQGAANKQQGATDTSKFVSPRPNMKQSWMERTLEFKEPVRCETASKMNIH